MNILDTELICFNTKKRAPYKIVFETIEYNLIIFYNISSVEEL